MGKREIFRSAKGILINADVQGALNIIRKAVPKAFPPREGGRDRGCQATPKESKYQDDIIFCRWKLTRLTEIIASQK